MLLNKIKKIIYRQQGSLFSEPVIVFESDDWGLERSPAGEILKKIGMPGPWADESTESQEDLEALYRVLEKYRDRDGRPVCFTANFIMANPDWNKIEQNNFSRYHDVFISETSPAAVLQKYREGIKRKCFYPQYHGRAHFSEELWIEDLKQDIPGARTLFKNRHNGGLSLLHGQGWRYHSEYLNWKTGLMPRPDILFERISSALKKFEELFDYPSYSTIPPQYIFTEETAMILKTLGVRYIQGAGYRLFRNPDGSQKIRSHYLGEVHPEGLICMTRSVKFDPRPERPENNAGEAFKQILRCFKSGLPAVIDTHRINYTGKYRKEALLQLDWLLENISRYNPIFLNTVELGEAVSVDGSYMDAFENKTRKLTAKQKNLTRLARALNILRG